MENNIREELFIKYLFEGNSQTDAYIKAGYEVSHLKSRKVIGDRAHVLALKLKEKIGKLKENIKSSIVDELNSAGLTDRRIAKELYRKITATEQRVTKDGDVVDIEGHYIHLKALELTSKIKGYFKDIEKDTQVNIKVTLSDINPSRTREVIHPSAELSRIQGRLAEVEDKSWPDNTV